MCPFKYLTNGLADAAALFSFIASLPFLGWLSSARQRGARGAAAGAGDATAAPATGAA